MSHVCIPHGVMCSDTCRSCMYRLFWHGPWLQTTDNTVTNVPLLRQLANWHHAALETSLLQSQCGELLWEGGHIRLGGRTRGLQVMLHSMQKIFRTDNISAHLVNRNVMASRRIFVKMENQHIQVARSNIQNRFSHPLQILEANLTLGMSGDSYLVIKQSTELNLDHVIINQLSHQNLKRQSLAKRLIKDIARRGDLRKRMMKETNQEGRGTVCPPCPCPRAWHTRTSLKRASVWTTSSPSPDAVKTVSFKGSLRRPLKTWVFDKTKTRRKLRINLAW